MTRLINFTKSGQSYFFEISIKESPASNGIRIKPRELSKRA